MACFVRPGTAPFLEWARTRFDDIVVVTSVPERRASHVVDQLVRLGELPTWCAEVHIVGGARGPKSLVEIFG